MLVSKFMNMENAKIKNLTEETLSSKKYQLKMVAFEYQLDDGSWDQQKREVYDAGNAVSVLLYNKEKHTILLNKQLRIASYLNGNYSGMLIETCAGKVEENEDPKDTVLREILEETGYQVESAEKIFEAYASPGAYTELIYFYTAAYTSAQKTSEGGGKADEHEHIALIEMDFGEACRKVDDGLIRDAKTIMLIQYAQLKQLFR